jgi:hypothetical protein
MTRLTRINERALVHPHQGTRRLPRIGTGPKPSGPYKGAAAMVSNGGPHSIASKNAGAGGLRSGPRGDN